MSTARLLKTDLTKITKSLGCALYVDKFFLKRGGHHFGEEIISSYDGYIFIFCIEGVGG